MSIDLTQLPAPSVVDALDFETIFGQMLNDLIARETSFSALVESDPAYKILEVAAYRELLIRQRVNDSAKAIMLAYAVGADLDQLGANFNVSRQLITPADNTVNPPVAAVYESDERFRRRIQMAFEGYSTAGPIGAYEFHTLSASPAVKDVNVSSPAPGDVLVTILSSAGNGTPDAALLAAVEAALNDESVRPLTDHVVVQGPSALPGYAVDATLKLYAGPDAETVRLAAVSAVSAYVTEHHQLGHDITLSGLYAALHRPGVQKVILNSPAADIVVAATEAAYCTGITIGYGGIDE